MVSFGDLFLTTAWISGKGVCMYVLGCVQLFAAPWTVAHQAPVSMVFYARLLEWVAISFSGQGGVGSS